MLLHAAIVLFHVKLSFGTESCKGKQGITLILEDSERKDALVKERRHRDSENRKKRTGVSRDG